MLKNNWGLDWGESGYYKLSIGNLSNTNPGICLIAETKYNVIPIIWFIIFNNYLIYLI